MVSEPYESKISFAGEGPPLILVPGMDGTGKLFYRQVPLLAKRYRVVTYALRDDASDMDDLVEDLARLVAEVSPTGDPAVIVGESFGGALALSFALAKPDLVDALVILNSFPRFLPQVRLRLSITALRAFPWKAMTVVRRFTAFRLHSQYTHREEIHRFLDLTAESSRHGYINRLRILERYDVRDRLTDIEVPTLFLAADEDHLVPAVEQAQYMAERVPDATLRVLHGHGHICLIAPNVDLLALIEEWRPTAGNDSAVEG